ncbi:hypothetical protein CK203_040732 [Vitis vinifera]|uniref:Uncharacterized protein n=1 Tax=Vitis vinifera TaxID=29760 RepID=A0A438HF74_VITVI|nr:hypothetical protein CK203_040732 [Vitis vinifera]
MEEQQERRNVGEKEGGQQSGPKPREHRIDIVEISPGNPNIEAVRKCCDCSSTSKYDDEALAWMMPLDGCFLLQLIYNTEDDSTINLSNVLRCHQIYFVGLDLFLLENQLPFESSS